MWNDICTIFELNFAEMKLRECSSLKNLHLHNVLQVVAVEEVKDESDILSEKEFEKFASTVEPEGKH